MKALRTVTTQVTRKGLTEIIPVVQSDSGRSIDFVISDMAIPSGATATFYALKPDGTEVFSDCVISDNTVTVNLTTQALAVIGTVKCQVQIISGSDTVTSFKFALAVEQSLVSDSAVESSNEFTALTTALSTIGSLQSQVNNLIANAGDTDGNAELLDIRVGFDGTTYDTAGGAVRGQINTALRMAAEQVTVDNYATILPSANDAEVKKIYNLVFGSGTDIPSDLPYTTNESILATLTTYGYDDGTVKAQTLVNTKGTYYRYSNADGTWNTWYSLSTMPMAEMLAYGIGKGLPWFSFDTTAKKIAINGTIRAIIQNTDASKFLDISQSQYPDGWDYSAVTTTTKALAVTSSLDVVVISFADVTPNHAVLFYFNSNADQLVNPNNVTGDFPYRVDGVIYRNADNTFQMAAEQVTVDNYATVLPSANDAEVKRVYNLVFGSGSDIPANLPYTTNESILATLTTYGYDDGTIKAQTLVNTKGTYYRYSNADGTWNTWYDLTSSGEATNKTFTVGSGGDYTSFTAGLAEAIKYSDSTLYVLSGTYDIIDELGGDTYTESYTKDANGWGLKIENGIRVIFSSDAKLVCNYTGSNAEFKTYFSPLNSGAGGFTLQNCTIEASNCRYCVHDERSTYTDRHTNTYLNCYFTLDNSGNTVWASKQCIGGGLGTNGEIIIRDCYFTSAGLDASTGGIVSYHNSASADAKSRVVVTGCYFDGEYATARFSWYGNSEKISMVTVSNCSLGQDIIIRNETSDGTSPYENVTLYEWNNVIRS